MQKTRQTRTTPSWLGIHQFNKRKSRRRGNGATDLSFNVSSTSIVRDKFAPYFIRQIAARMARSLAEALKPFGETPNSWRIMLHLVESGDCTPTDLCELVQIDQSTISRTLQQMRRRKLVVSRKHHSDSRTTLVSLTPEGREKFNSLVPVAVAQNEWLMRGVSRRDQQRLVHTLQQMLTNIRFSPLK